MCHHVSSMLSRLASQTRNFSPEEFTAICQKDILEHQSRLADVVQLMQKVFSVPSFLISVTHFTNCIVAIAIIAHRFFKELHYTIVLHWVFIMTNSFGGLLACLWIAGRLPVEAEILQEEFRKKTRQRLLSSGKSEEICFENALVGKSNFTLSGCVSIIKFDMKFLKPQITVIDNKKDESNLTLSNSKWYLKYPGSSNFLLRILYWTGLLENSGRRYIIVCLYFTVYTILSMGKPVQTLELNGSFVSRIQLLSTCSAIVSSFIWHSVRRRKKFLSILLAQVYPRLTKRQIFSFMFIFGSSFALAIIEVKKEEEINKFNSFDSFYGFKFNHFWTIIFTFLQYYMGYLLCPTWTNIIAFLYCLMCHHISSMLSRLASQIQKYSPEEFTAIRQKDILEHQSKLADVVQLMQKVFSVPSFIISVTHFTNCIVAIAIFAHRFFTELHYTVVLHWVFNITNSIGGLLACLWIAGRLPVEAEILQEEFRKKSRQRLLSNGKSEEICFENALVGKSNFILSGCAFLYCLMCHHISSMLSRLASQTRNFSPEEFTSIRQKDILEHQSRLADVVQLMQKVFSVPSFIISVTHFSNCIVAIAIFAHRFFTELHYTVVLHWVFNIINSFGGLLACLWIAGRLPVEAEILQEEFRKKSRQRLLSSGKSEEICFENALVGKSNFTLSGCGIFYFQRNCIAALAGTILSYAVLLISQN
ncbi:hypothetical protein HNY73_016783 [Argiope bruennichi]|uniref:Gustatory receptor n=1 Tax=Argiope bruennichi TaxID=94029 RepID=A0A8T0ENV8_ARGBR|nr:hypothetical protein HNY73_016783 [Argiope bruennichi]